MKAWEASRRDAETQRRRDAEKNISRKDAKAPRKIINASENTEDAELLKGDR